MIIIGTVGIKAPPSCSSNPLFATEQQQIRRQHDWRVALKRKELKQHVSDL